MAAKPRKAGYGTIEIVERSPTAVGSYPSAGLSKAPLAGSAVSGAWHAISSPTPDPSPLASPCR